MLKVINLSWKLWKQQIRRADFWIVIIVLGAFCWSYFGAGREYMMIVGDTVGIFSVFPAAMTDEGFILVTCACLLILISDVPVIYEGMEFQILRISRMKWYASQLLYVVFLDISFFLLTAIIQLGCFLPAVSLSKEWGSGIEKGTAFQTYGSGAPKTLLAMDARIAFGEAFLLFILLGLLFSLVCLICNLLGAHNGLGILICIAAICWRSFCLRYTYGGMDVGYLSPVGLLGSYYGYTRVSVLGAVAYYVFFCCLIIIVGIFQVDHTDIKCGAKQ